MKDPEEVLKENPGSVIFARYAEKLAREGKIVEALEVLNNGIEANPYYAPGYSVLAEIYSMQESQEKSAEQLEKALSLEPQTPGDLFNLGKYLINNQPEKAKDYFWAAYCYEPDVPEVKSVFEKDLLPEEMSDKLTLAPDTKEALTELATEAEIPEEVEESIEESTGMEESVVEEIQEDTEISLATEGDDIQSVEATETEELSEKEAIEESEETIPGEGISDYLDLLPETKEVLTELTEEAEVPEEVEEGIEEISGIEESIMEEPQEDTDISLSAEGDDVQSIEEKETEELPEEEAYTGAEKDITGEVSSDLTDVIGDAQTAEKTQLENLEQPLEQEEEETTGEAKEIFDEIDDKELLGYSEMLEGSESMEMDSSAKDLEETGILEIEEDEEYDVSKLEHDLSTGEVEEPVLTEEERAELLALEESSQDVDKDLEGGGKDTTQLEDSEHTELMGETKPEIEVEESDKTLTEDLYGDLSKNEIDVLSITDTEPDDIEKHLETETKEGIDYSDILYGQESAIESEETSEAVSEKEIKPEEELEKETGIEDISPPETKEENSKDTLIDTEDILTADQDKSVTTDEASTSEIILDEKREIESGESEPEVETSDLATDNVEILEDKIKGSIDFELSFTEQDIQDVENSSLDELIDDYVDVLKDSSDKPEQKEIDYSEEDNSPESLTEYKEVELELSGDKPLDEEVGEAADTVETTATMAEIFVSQGLITRAIEIYKVLYKKEPDNEGIKARLEELQKMLDD